MILIILRDGVTSRSRYQDSVCLAPGAWPGRMSWVKLSFLSGTEMASITPDSRRPPSLSARSWSKAQYFLTGL